jgi:hypothetical protein
MRKLWLLVALLILLPVVVTLLKVSGGVEWSALLPLWFALLIALLLTIMARLLSRVANWQVHWCHGNSQRNQGGSDEKNRTVDSADRIVADFHSRSN